MYPSRNIAILKENVQKPGNSFDLYRQKTRMSMAEYDHIKDTTMFVEEEEIKIAGHTQIARRLYVKPESSEFIGVGWIINEDITACMVCGRPFNLFRWPHHCRSCGNVICQSCSPESAEIVELQELGEVRVCIQCFWGQSPVHAAHIRKPFGEEGSSQQETADHGDAGPGIIEDENSREVSRFKEDVESSLLLLAFLSMILFLLYWQ